MTDAVRGSEDLQAIAAAVRAHPGLTSKSAIGLVSEVLGPSDWTVGPGDDGAVVPTTHGRVVACGEALWPPFVARDPHGAGFAAVLTNVNDLAAMGAVPLGIVDTIVADDRTARSVLEGIRHACELYGVQVLGGHLTRHDGEPAVSAFGVGEVDVPLSVTRAEPGQSLVVAAVTDGHMRADFPFFPAFERRGTRSAGDVAVLAELARSGAAVAAKDISMAGLVGSLAMLLEWGPFGVALDLDVTPAPEDVDLTAWLTCFPSFGFLLCVPAGREDDALEPFHRRGIAAAVAGRLDDGGILELRRGGESATVLDLRSDPVTRLTRSPR